MKNIFTLLLLAFTSLCFAQESNFYISAEAQVWRNAGDFSHGSPYSFANTLDLDAQPYAIGVSQTGALTVGMEQNGNFRLHLGVSISQMHNRPNVLLGQYSYGFLSFYDDFSYYYQPGTLLSKVHITSLETPIGFDVRILGRKKLKLWTSMQFSPTFVVKRNVELVGFSSDYNGSQNELHESIIDKGIKINGGFIHTALRLEYSLTEKFRLNFAPQLALVDFRDRNFFKPEGLGETYDNTFETSTLIAKNWGASLGISRVF